MPEIKQVQAEEEYDAVLARISELLGAEPYSAEDEELDRLSDLVIQYEDEHYLIDRAARARAGPRIPAGSENGKPGTDGRSGGRWRRP